MPLFPLNPLLPAPYFLLIYAIPVSSSSIVGLLRAGCGSFVVWRLAAVVVTFNAHAIAANDECGGRADAGNWLVPPVAARS